MEKSDRKKKTSLVLSLLTVIALAVIVTNLLQTLVITGRMKKEALKADEEKYLEMAEAYAISITNRINGMYDSLDYYVNAEIVQTENEQAIINWLLSVPSKRNKDFSRVFYCGPSGDYMADDGSHANISDRSYFKDVFYKGMERTIDDPVFSKSNGKAVVHVTRAVKVNGRTIGLFCGVVDLTYINQVVNDISVGETGYGWMLASDGTVISHKMKDYVMQRNFVTAPSEGHEDMAPVAAKVAAGDRGMAEIAGLRKGQRDFIFYHGIEGTPWGLAFSIEGTEVFSLSNSVRNYIMIGGLITIIGLLVISGILLYRSIKPLQIVETTINGIASGNADLTKRIEIDSKNEIGEVVNGFNKFTEKLQLIIKEVKNSKEELSVAGEDMGAASEDTASSITQIIANIESMHQQIVGQSASVEQTAGAVNQIASNIASLENMIESQSAGVTQASAAVEEMIGNIKSVNQSVEKMASSFSELSANASNGITKQQAVNERIKQIEEQSAMLQEANAAISAIAEQTNLLAMNAAIEAAHAGEAGKGFSVVADEIRKLSETSTEQSRTIGDRLNGIKESIGTVVAASNDSSEAFEAVSHKIKETDELVLQIKAAMEEQNEGSRQISEALHSMNDSTVQVRNASSEMNAGQKAILEEVSRLQTATSSMKNSMDEMSVGARKINETGATLSEISGKMKESIDKIGGQIDLFKV